MENKTFAGRLTAAMGKQNLKQVDFLREADKAGIKLGKSQMSQYVSGKAVPRKNIALFLAGILKVDAQWLFRPLRTYLPKKAYLPRVYPVRAYPVKAYLAKVCLPKAYPQQARK